MYYPTNEFSLIQTADLDFTLASAFEKLLDMDCLRVGEYKRITAIKNKPLSELTLNDLQYIVEIYRFYTQKTKTTQVVYRDGQK